MRLSNMLNAALVFAAKADVRYYLNGVNIYYQGNKIKAIAATDGHSLQFLSATDNQHKKLKLCENVIVSIHDVKRLIAIYDTHEYGDVSVKELIKFIAPIDGRFPDVSRVIPDIEDSKLYGQLSIGMNYKYLARINTSTTKLKKGYNSLFSHATFNFKGANDAVRVDVTVEDMHSTIVIMPARV